MPAEINEHLKPYQLKAALEEFEGATTLTDAYPAYVTVVQAARPYTCPKCHGEGLHALSLDTGDEADTDLIECTFQTDDGAQACEGFGSTESQCRIRVVGTTVNEVVA